MKSLAWDGDWDVTQDYNPPVHMGIDIGMPVGTTLFAVTPGRVARVQPGMLTVDIGDGFTEFYLHIDHAIVPVGAAVKIGDSLAVSGDVVVDPRFPITGPHLHFEVQGSGFGLPGIPTNPGAPLDPVPFLEGKMSPELQAHILYMVGLGRPYTGNEAQWLIDRIKAGAGPGDTLGAVLASPEGQVWTARLAQLRAVGAVDDDTGLVSKAALVKAVQGL